MMIFSILFILIIVLFFSARKLLSALFVSIEKQAELVKSEYVLVNGVVSQLKKDNALLGEKLSRTVAMYELTKQICRTLEEEKVFGAFRKQLEEFAGVKDCRIIEPDADIRQFKDKNVMPLEVDSRLIGYLLTGPINKESQDAFLILAHQFMLGMKRVFLYRRVQELAVVDSLTGAFTRSYYLERFEEELTRSQKFGYKLSYLMVDIDNFKGLNDNYGHLVGDAILREVAGLIKEKIRQIDSLGRYGGDEFLVNLPETDSQGAVFAAERIRQAVEAKVINVYDEKLKVTVTIGVSTFPEHGKDNPVLIDNADKALYQAKEQGRNRVVVFH